MKFGAIEIDPAKNPAILDTATWDPTSAWCIVRELDQKYWLSFRAAVAENRLLPKGQGFTPHVASCAKFRGGYFFLASLADGQHVFVEVGSGSRDSVLGEPMRVRQLTDGGRVALYKTDAWTIDRYCRLINPDKGPKALGAVPRLGIGTRMSTAVWPGVWRAMHNCGFAANAIQNSVRELNLLDDLMAGRPARTNYLLGFGTLDEGHTGSTFEGLWVSGVLEALKTDTRPKYGADADHIMVKRGTEGISRAKRVIDAARYYSFFTLDVSDILDYAALGVSSNTAAEEYLADNIRQVEQRTAILAYHCQKRHIGGRNYQFDKATIGRLVGKYWSALHAVEELFNHIKALKHGLSFDLELGIDENPPEVSTFESVTTDKELVFLIREMQRRQVPVTHIAPNFGIVKGQDYRGSDGLAGLEERVRELHHIANEQGILLDCHSGDDLESATRKAIGRATDGQIHFKISPALQIIFAEALSDFDPELFRFWWDDTLEYAGRQKATGSELACNSIHEYESGGNAKPSPRHTVFRHYCFATVGRRNAHGQFIHREKFYTLPASFYQEYQRRVQRYLCEVADDVFGRGS